MPGEEGVVAKGKIAEFLQSRIINANSYSADTKTSLAVQKEDLKSLTQRKEKALVEKLPALLKHKESAIRVLALQAQMQFDEVAGLKSAPKDAGSD